MSSTQSHHYLPQSYQRGWANLKGQVHVYAWHYNKLVCKSKSTRSTGAKRGLYFVPMATAEKQNIMEDQFWRQIDQWGADSLALLRSSAPEAESKLNRLRLAAFIISLLYRNPQKIEQFNLQTKSLILGGVLSEDYDAHRYPHEPDTFEEFQAALDQPGMNELAAQFLRSLVFNKAILTQLLSMDWQVVTINNGEVLLTSDCPVITYKGLKDPDGLLMLPLSPTEFFVAFNNGPINMTQWIDDSIQNGSFVESMNKYVIQHKIEFVYAHDDSQKEFVEKYWGSGLASA